MRALKKGTGSERRVGTPQSKCVEMFFLARNLEQEAAELTEQPVTRLCFLRYLLFFIWLRPDGRAELS